MCDDLVTKHQARLESSGGLFSGLRVAVVLSNIQQARVYTRIITAGGGTVLPMTNLQQLSQQWWGKRERERGEPSPFYTEIIAGETSVWRPWILLFWRTPSRSTGPSGRKYCRSQGTSSCDISSTRTSSTASLSVTESTPSTSSLTRQRGGRIAVRGNLGPGS